MTLLTKGGRRSKAQDDPAGEGWADKQSELAVGGPDRNRRGQSAGRDEARQEPVAGWDAECVRRAVDRRKRRQGIDRQHAEKRQSGEDRSLDRRAGVSDEQNMQPVPAIREHTADRHQHDVRGRVGQRDDGQPRRRMREIPRCPRQGNRLDEEAQPRKDRTKRIPTKIPVAESLGYTPQAERQDRPPKSLAPRRDVLALTLRLGAAPPASAS